VDLGQAALGRKSRRRLHDAAVERHEAPVTAPDDAVAGIRETWVDAEHDHVQ